VTRDIRAIPALPPQR